MPRRLRTSPPRSTTWATPSGAHPKHPKRRPNQLLPNASRHAGYRPLIQREVFLRTLKTGANSACYSSIMTGSSQSRWCIAGKGAIGMSLAYRLQHHSIPVTLLTRENEGDLLELKYQPFGGEVHDWTCDALWKPDGRPIDHLVIATKSYSVQQVLDTWSEALSPGAVVYFLQNGIGCEAQGLPVSTRPLYVVNGGFTAYLVEPNHVVQSAMEPIWIGTETGDPLPPDLEPEFRMLNAAGFQVTWTESIMLHRWRKSSINTIVNTQAALYDCDNGSLLEHPQAIEDTRLMCEELGALFKAMSIDLTCDHLHEATTSLLQATARNICSTLQDFRNGLANHELDYITLPLLEHGRTRGVSTPRCEALYAEISNHFRKNADRST